MSHLFNSPATPNNFISNPLKSNPATLFSSETEPHSVCQRRECRGFEKWRSSRYCRVVGLARRQKKHLRRYAEWYNARGMHGVTFFVNAKDLLGFDLGKKVERRITELANELTSWVSEREDDKRDRCSGFPQFQQLS